MALAFLSDELIQQASNDSVLDNPPKPVAAVVETPEVGLEPV